MKIRLRNLLDLVENEYPSSSSRESYRTKMNLNWDSKGILDPCHDLWIFYFIDKFGSACELVLRG